MNWRRLLPTWFTLWLFAVLLLFLSIASLGEAAVQGDKTAGWALTGLLGIMLATIAAKGQRAKNDQEA